MSTATLPPPIKTVSPDALTEVVYGEIVEKDMSAGTTWLASRLHTRLDTFSEANHLGTVVVKALFVLDAAADLKRRPDVAFVSAERWPAHQNPPMEGDWEIAPDLAVEVASPHDTVNHLEGKIADYFEHGVRQVWAIVPEQQKIYVFDSPIEVRIVSRTGVLESALLPGFKLPLATLFRSQGGNKGS